MPVNNAEARIIPERAPVILSRQQEAFRLLATPDDESTRILRLRIGAELSTVRPQFGERPVGTHVPAVEAHGLKGRHFRRHRHAGHAVEEAVDGGALERIRIPNRIGDAVDRPPRKRIKPLDAVRLRPLDREKALVPLVGMGEIGAEEAFNLAVLDNTSSHPSPSCTWHFQYTCCHCTKW